MKLREVLPGIVMFISMFLLVSCLLPGMIPVSSEPEGPMPVMEENTDAVLEVLRGGDWHLIQSLAEEQYTDEDYAKPGTLTYTVNVTDDLPVYFSYGWCAVDEATLAQNIEHMSVKLSVNGEELEGDVIHNLSFTAPNDMLCADYGALITEWPAGQYQLEAVATFDETINDGVADFDAGDYVFKYEVEVSGQPEAEETPQ
ncbi:MAG TPA: hypothetical protein VJ785_08525 [Anaerolineales bacterium]|nr:hypothetical protein [Anaerolineales bacterium]